MIEFIETIRSITGSAPSLAEIIPGKLVRFATSDKHGDESGWCKLFDDCEGGIFGCWRQGISETWQARKPRTPEEQAVFRARVNRAQEESNRLETEHRAECRRRSVELWEKGRDVDVKHPYLVAKNVRPYGIRQLKESLLVPVRDSGGTLHGLQFIGPDGSKKFKTGTAVAGCYHAIGKPNGKLLIAEGLATASTLHEITGHAVACAFNAGNLKPVAEALKAKLPNTVLVVCADDDHVTEGNPGLTKATEAALAVNGLLAVPVFPANRGPKDTDFNDLAKLTTPESFRSCIESAATPIPLLTEAPPARGTLESQGPDAWPEPILFGEIQTPEISCSILPGWLGDYAAAVAATTQTPQGMSVMMAIAVVAACVQKRFQVARAPEYVEPLAVWTVTGLPPASRKTAVVNAFTGPLTAWEKERGEADKRERERIAGVREAIEVKVKTLHANAGKADDSTERNELIDEACKLREEMPEPLVPPRIFTGDVTPERLQDLMMEQGERMAVLSDEGGIFAVMAGLYSGGKANIDIFLKGHAGSAVRVDRQGRTAHLDEPALTFGLCIQPDIIRRLSETSFRGNGCLARFLFCLPVSNIGTRSAYTIPVPESVKAAYQAGISSLLNIPPVLNEHGKEMARTILLDHGATQAWEAFFDFMENDLGEGKELEPIQDWAGKLPGAALRIAGIMAIVEHGERAKVINEQTMTRALDLCELLITHAKAAFDLMNGDDALHDAKHVYRWILAKGALVFKRRDAQQELTRFREVDRLEKALAVLTKRYIVSEPQKVKSETGRGMPSIVHHVNPAIFVQQH